jgi:GMP synthase-like glutamine amidotransferase
MPSENIRSAIFEDIFVYLCANEQNIKKQAMKRLTHLVTNIVLISSLVFLLSCSTDDNAARKDDKPFFIGLQYHPEVAVSKHANGAADASRFMDYEDALCYFQALVNYRSLKINPCQFSPKTF